jgi:hypothetical protein
VKEGRFGAGPGRLARISRGLRRSRTFLSGRDLWGCVDDVLGCVVNGVGWGCRLMSEEGLGNKKGARWDALRGVVGSVERDSTRVHQSGKACTAAPAAREAAGFRG